MARLCFAQWYAKIWADMLMWIYVVPATKTLAQVLTFSISLRGCYQNPIALRISSHMIFTGDVLVSKIRILKKIAPPSPSVIQCVEDLNTSLMLAVLLLHLTARCPSSMHPYPPDKLLRVVLDMYLGMAITSAVEILHKCGKHSMLCLLLIGRDPWDPEIVDLYKTLQ